MAIGRCRRKCTCLNPYFLVVILISMSIFISMSRGTKDAFSGIVLGMLVIVPFLILIALLYGLVQALMAIVLAPVVLYVWSLIGSSIGMFLIAMVSPSFADDLIRKMDIEFPGCMKSTGYWITLVTSVAYLIVALKICNEPDIAKSSGDDKMVWLLKCAFFVVLPFFGAFRMGRVDR